MMIRNGTYDNRSAGMREYWVDGHCYDCHPKCLVNATHIDQPHAVKPFGYYPEVIWQPGAWLIPKTEPRVIKSVAVVDAFLHRMIKSG